ncbi:jacalin-related lectin 3 isoform X2 [Cornus florida]|uniref:jacalin-related lectin 3 isoform X2 n=1 Tax=Cornus florida TaxID=4283 RepID=UPI0028989557|nr:jacalin-related lectin 3 isoform X2 [Cornus florida]
MSLEDNGGKNTISVGPWGGQDGFRWDDGVCSTVKQLVVAHGAGIDSIRIEYEKNGTSVWSEKHGGSGGLKTDKVKLEYPDEYLTSIHGHYGSLNEWGPVFVRSLTFQSNKKIYGPFGVEQGMYFSFPMTGGKIVGFHGKRGWYLDAIGAYLEPLYNKPSPPKSLLQSQNSVANGTDPKLGYSIIQGSIGQKFDMVLALRQKDDYSNPLSNNMSRQSSSSSQEFSDTDSKAKAASGVSNTFVRVPSNNVKGVMTYGTWGGAGGSVFDDGVYTGIRQIILSRNVGLVSIRVLYDQNDQPMWGNKNGGTGGFKTDKIFFDYPYEILTHMTGFYGPTMLMGPTIIKSLTFHTTKTKYGPFGEETGQSFSTNLKEGKIVGFHGRKGLFVDAIGVHVVEGKVFPPIRSPSISFNQSEVHIHEVDHNDQQRPNKLVQVKKALTDELLGHKVVKEPAQGGPGPWGGEGGRQWDDGVFMGIKQIHLTRSNAICSIQIEYDRSGQSVWSAKHGGDSGGAAIPIKLEYPNEVVTCISGFYGPIRGDEGTKVIKSLTFHTSRRKFGPYGEEIGIFFTSVTTEGKVVGFHGRSGMYLDAIGVHMQHWLGNQRQLRPSSLRKFFH